MTDGGLHCGVYASMARPKSNIRKVTATIALPEDLRNELRYMLEEQGVSVSALLRWGAMLVIEAAGLFPLPPSVAHLRRAPYGGQARWGKDETDPDFAILHFNDPAVYGALVKRVERCGGTIAHAAYEYMVAGIDREAELDREAERGLN